MTDRTDEDDAIAQLQRIAEAEIPVESRPPDWNERWQVVRLYIFDLVSGDTKPLQIRDQDRIAVAQMDYQHHMRDAEKRLDFQQELGVQALKGLTLVNGGAIIGLVTFIGNKGTTFNQWLLGWAMLAFAGGLVIDLIAYILGYLSQSEIMNMSVSQGWNAQRTMVGVPIDQTEVQKHYKRGEKVLRFAIAAAVLSLGAFCLGVALAARAFFCGT